MFSVQPLIQSKTVNRGRAKAHLTDATGAGTGSEIYSAPPHSPQRQPGLQKEVSTISLTRWPLGQVT